LYHTIAIASRRGRSKGRRGAIDSFHIPHRMSTGTDWIYCYSVHGLRHFHYVECPNVGGGVSVAGQLVYRSLDCWKLPIELTVFAASLNKLQIHKHLNK